MRFKLSINLLCFLQNEDQTADELGVLMSQLENEEVCNLVCITIQLMTSKQFEAVLLLIH